MRGYSNVKIKGLIEKMSMDLSEVTTLIADLLPVLITMSIIGLLLKQFSKFGSS